MSCFNNRTFFLWVVIKRINIYIYIEKLILPEVTIVYINIFCAFQALRFQFPYLLCPPIAARVKGAN